MRCCYNDKLFMLQHDPFFFSFLWKFLVCGSFFSKTLKQENLIVLFTTED